jgi:Xaa-Pro aminopeptidase
MVGGLRLHKDDGEVARIEAASAIADAALAAVRPRLAEGLTEAAFGLALDGAMRALGADDVSFETIVASGPNGAKPHHRPARRTIAEGDLVVIDFGALVDGYHSDMTRTVMVGEPTPTQARMYEVVLEAQAAGVAAVADGVAARAVDEACRAVIDRAGWGDAFLHGTGHGVGLDIHEDPRVGQTATATLSSRCVVTVEPGVYLPEHGGVRIEDTVVVTPDGCRPVTLTPKTAAV